MALTYYLSLAAADAVVDYLGAHPRFEVRGPDGVTYHFALAATEDRTVFRFNSLLAPEWLALYIKRWMEQVQAATSSPLGYLVTKHITSGKIGTV